MEPLLESMEDDEDRIVAAVDPGTRNLGIVIKRGTRYEYMGVWDLIGKKKPRGLEICGRLCYMLDKNPGVKALLKNAHSIEVERQFRGKQLQAVEAAFFAKFPKNCRSFSKFKLGKALNTGSRTRNKKVSAETYRHIVDAYCNEHGLPLMSNQKVHHLTDCIAMLEHH